MKKSCALFLLPAALLSAAEFQTGQAARAVIGQENFTRQQPGATQRIVGGVSGVAYAADTLFVVDSNRVEAFPQNNRLLIYRNISGMVPAAGAPIPTNSGRCPVCAAAATTVLGQRDFTLNGINGTTATDAKGNPTGDARAISAFGLRTPTAVASDGRHVAVADTDNNRVLIWNSIPDSAAAPADIVLGQADFKSNKINYDGNARTPNAKGLKGPQGVWIQGDMLMVADTQNHRVLIWKTFPTQSGQGADLVLGQKDFTSYVEPDIAKTTLDPKPFNMLNPVSVTSDGTRIYVADLGHNRILVWNSIPTQNFAPADIALGQPDMTSAIANNTSALCESTGTDPADSTKKLYPARCRATLDFPRFALSDGKRLFVADGGNDRVLVYNSVPTSSGQGADVILGQKDEFTNLVQETDIFGQGAIFNPDMVGANAVRTPMALAWDGANLYVTDPYNRRVLVFTPGEDMVSRTGVRNAASLEIFAIGTVGVAGKATEGDEASISIADKTYSYKIVKDDTLENVITQLTNKINADSGDPKVFARANTGFRTVVLTARAAGDAGNAVSYGVATKPAKEGGIPDISLTTSGANLRGGQDAAKIAPGTLVTLLGQNLADREYTTGSDDQPKPFELGGVEVYFDGIRAPLWYVSPTQINAQVPYSVSDTTGLTAWIRTRDAAGNAKFSSAVAVPIVLENPGIFADFGTDPRPAIVLHESSFATGAVGIDGIPKEGDVVTVSIGEGDAKKDYSYTVKKTGDTVDTLAQIRDALVALIDTDERVHAEAAGYYARIRLFSRTPGPDGEGLKFTTTSSTGAGTILSNYGDKLCCASTAGARVTEEKPARPGETIVFYGTGLGLIGPAAESQLAIAGIPFAGSANNAVNSPLDVIVGGKTAQLLYAGLEPGKIGIYRIIVQLNSDIPTNAQTQMTIAQDIYVSNIVTFAVNNPSETTTP